MASAFCKPSFVWNHLAIEIIDNYFFESSGGSSIVSRLLTSSPYAVFCDVINICAFWRFAGKLSFAVPRRFGLHDNRRTSRIHGDGRPDPSPMATVDMETHSLLIAAALTEQWVIRRKSTMPAEDMSDGLLSKGCSGKLLIRAITDWTTLRNGSFQPTPPHLHRPFPTAAHRTS